MANVIIDNTHLTNIANAIREKADSSDKYKPGEMADAISAIEVGEIIVDPTAGNGGIVYTDIISNEDGTYTLKDGDGVEHLMTPTYDNGGAITAITLDDNTIDLTYTDGSLTAIGTINTDFSNVRLSKTYPDWSLSIEGLKLNTVNTIISGEEYVMPEGATTLTVDVVWGNLETSGSGSLSAELYAYFGIEFSILDGTPKRRFDQAPELITAMEDGTFEIYLDGYQAGTEIDLAAIGTGAFTGTFKFGFTNAKAGTNMSSTTFSMPDLSITNITFKNADGEVIQ